jgi:hypothetical protein
MASNSLIPNYEELSTFISSTFSTLRAPYMEWANLARRAIQGLQYNSDRLSELEDFINARREVLRKAVMMASEHFDEALLVELRNKAHMSKTAWRSLKKNGPITIKNGFKLVSY